MAGGGGCHSYDELRAMHNVSVILAGASAAINLFTESHDSAANQLYGPGYFTSVMRFIDVILLSWA